MAVRLPGGAVSETLGAEGTEGVGALGRMPLVLPRRGKALGEATLAVEATPEAGATVGRHGPPCALGPPGVFSDRRKTPWVWRNMQPKHTSCALYGIDGAHTLCYQSLARGLGFLMKNSG